MTDYQYLDDDTGLQEVCRQCRAAGFVAVDSEFIRTDTYYPKAGLIQLGFDNRVFLVDPLAVQDWSPLRALFEDPWLCKVLHSCSEDLEVFQRLLSCRPQPLLDTQIGAALAGYGAGISYQRLVEACLGQHVEKGETRSDWLQRPLSARQCDYAALDVSYLQEIYLRLREQLEKSGRLGWWQDECRQLVESAVVADNRLYYLRLKMAWKLRGDNLRVLRDLCAWREGEAQCRNLPRGWVIKDSSCFEIARHMPANMTQLSGIGDLNPKAVRRYGEQILDIVSAALREPCEDSPVAPQMPLAGDELKKFKRLKSFVQARAEHAGLPPELLLRKKDMEELLRHRRWPSLLPGWRREVLGEGLQPYLEERA